MTVHAAAMRAGDCLKNDGSGLGVVNAGAGRPLLCTTVHGHPGVHTTAGALLAVAYPSGPGDGPVTHIWFIDFIHGHDPRFDLGFLELLFTIVLAASFALAWRRKLTAGTYIMATALAYSPVRFANGLLARSRESGGRHTLRRADPRAVRLHRALRLWLRDDPVRAQASPQRRRSDRGGADTAHADDRKPPPSRNHADSAVPLNGLLSPFFCVHRAGCCRDAVEARDGREGTSQAQSISSDTSFECASMTVPQTLWDA